MTEGELYFFSLPTGIQKAVLTNRIEKALVSAQSGRILGSGMSLGDQTTIVVEIGAYDREKAEEVISSLCQRLKCEDYDVRWD